MAVNPLYRNEFYFFSNMYDDSLITDFYRQISARSYERSIKYQQNMLGRKRHYLNSEIFYKSSLGEFEVNDQYNELAGLPTGSFTLRLSTMILPVFNKKKFLATYGLQYQKVPLVDFFKRNDIFDKSITIQIGKYRIVAAYLIHNLDKTVSLAISNSNTDGITSSIFNKVIAEYDSTEPVWIFSDEITQVYHIDTTTTVAVTDSPINGYYDIKIPKTANVNRIGSSRNHDQFNAWDCLISMNTSTHGRKLLVSSPSSLRTSTTSDLFFTVDKKFIDWIKSSGINFSIWFINRPNKKHILLYPYNIETSPILNLDYTYNPSGNINIEVYEFDSTNMCKGRKLYDPEFTQMYFPNIFDFSTLNTNNSDLLIEITEYDPSYTNQVMNNSIYPLIESLGPELYTEFVVNDHDKSIDGTSMNLKNYHPEYHPINFDEFISSDYKDDIRGYILDKITKTIESDPYLIASYYKWMLNKNSIVTTLSGTPKTFQFGTKRGGEFSGSNKIVMDTSIASITPDDIRYFTEEHSYITHYHSNAECPAFIYINGKYVRPTCTRYYKGMNYIFLPVSMINNEMSKYHSDEELIAASPITIDTYPNTHSSFIDVPTDRIIIESISDAINIFKYMESPVFSLDELVIYDNSTGKYLGSILDLFNINLAVSEYDIEHPEETSKVLISRDETPEYLLTVFGEVYTTMDNKPIILDNISVNLNMNNFIDEMISDGIISETDKRAFTHKKINFNNINLIPKNDSLLGMDISIYSRAYKQERIVKSTSGIYDADKDVTNYTLTNADHDNDISRYFIYNDGLFDSSAELSKVHNKFGGDLTLTLKGNQIVEEKDIIVVHMPIGYHSEKFHFQKRVFYMKPAEKSANETDMLWPESANDGLILQTYSDRIYNSFTFESDVNIKFTADGHRLPPKSGNTNSLYRQYYDSARANAHALSNENHGTVLFIDNDCPIMDIAKQNPYASSFDETYARNPLDILTYIKPE